MRFIQSLYSSGIRIGRSRGGLSSLRIRILVWHNLTLRRISAMQDPLCKLDEWSLPGRRCTHPKDSQWAWWARKATTTQMTRCSSVKKLKLGVETINTLIPKTLLVIMVKANPGRNKRWPSTCLFWTIIQDIRARAWTERRRRRSGRSHLLQRLTWPSRNRTGRKAWIHQGLPTSRCLMDDFIPRLTSLLWEISREIMLYLSSIRQMLSRGSRRCLRKWCIVETS